MNINTPMPPPACVFRPEGIVTLADVRAAATAGLSGSRGRDMKSAFNVLADRLGIDLASFPASAPALRRLFSGNGPAALGVTASRYANNRSLVLGAVERSGMRCPGLTGRVPLSDAWHSLLQTVERREYRQGVKRARALLLCARHCARGGSVGDARRPVRGARC